MSKLKFVQNTNSSISRSISSVKVGVEEILKKSLTIPEIFQVQQNVDVEERLEDVMWIMATSIFLATCLGI